MIGRLRRGDQVLAVFEVSADRGGRVVDPAFGPGEGDHRGEVLIPAAPGPTLGQVPDGIDGDVNVLAVGVQPANSGALQQLRQVIGCGACRDGNTECPAVVWVVQDGHTSVKPPRTCGGTLGSRLLCKVSDH